MISNLMFDPQTNQIFDSSGNFSNAEWWPHPAIWSVNERRRGARSGVSGWPQDRMWISKYEQFHRSRTFREIIDQMLHWFTDPIEPINFGAMYFYEPDLTGSSLLVSPQSIDRSIFQAIERVPIRQT